jgi:dTDP-4-amino-4,6-dideoxygalactose transaminase
MTPKFRPYLGWQELLAAISFGAGRSQFEAAMAAVAGARYGLAFGYAHSAFYALLKVLNLTQAEIIIPAYTCDLMAAVIVRTDNIPVFVDIDLANFNMDLGALKKAITPQTRAIVATQMFGYPIDVPAIREMVGSEQIMIIEDSALNLPGFTSLRGDVGLFSFGPGKPIFTVRGGVAVTNRADLYEKLQTYRDNHMNGLPAKEWTKRWARLLVTYFSQNDLTYGLAIQLGLVDTNFERSTTSIADSFDTAYADFQARIGLALLGKREMLLAERQAAVALYNRELNGIPGFTPAPIVEGATYTYYTARIKNRDMLQFSQKMYQRGIQTGRTFDYAVPDFKEYRPYVRSVFHRAEQVGQEIINLPIHIGLSEAKVRFIANNVRQILQEGNDLLDTTTVKISNTVSNR